MSNINKGPTGARMSAGTREVTPLLVQDKEPLAGTREVTPLLTEDERKQILFDWNATACAYPYELCLHQLFDAQVARTPHDLAVIFEQSRLTYQELNVYSNQLAHYLQTLGVGPDVLVGVYMERSLEMIIALLGILKAGGAYVPLDPTYPSERIAFMLEDIASGAEIARPIVLSQLHLVEHLPTHNAHLLSIIVNDEEYEDLHPSGRKQPAKGVTSRAPVRPMQPPAGVTGRRDEIWPLRIIDGHDEIVLTQEPTNPISQTTANNLAYVIYTSGSTGKPKGVMNTHRAICNRLLWVQDTYQLTKADAVLQKAPFSFDISVGEFFWPLLTGARLVIARPEGQKDSAYLLSLIWEHQITILHFGPAMLQVFMEEPGQEACSSLRHVICGGEPLPYELQQRFFARYTAGLHNHYGPTEAAIDVTSWACKRDSKHSIIPIGHPINNTQIYILDPYGQPVPIGVQGELYIGGISVARGYLNRPQLTAERFVPDPFSIQPGARLYRTGDVARYLLDGAIEYLGRLDQQVKVRGFRIELGEIETVLTHHSAIREAVVMVREDVPDDKRLVAYIVFHKELHTTSAEIQQYMHQHIPPYMVPTLFIELSAFPLNNSDKVDRRALPAPGSMRPDLQHPFSAPRTPTEELIAGTWSQVLGIHPIGVDDNFFALGGHSLLAMRVTTLLRTRLQIEFPLRSFFATPTVAQFAELIDQLKTHKDAPLLPQIQALPRENAAPSFPLPHNAVMLPSSFAQQRLWFLDQLTPNSSAYTIPVTMDFQGQLDVFALERSLIEITRRHEVLRTTFTQSDGQLMQVITSASPVVLTHVNLQHIPEDERAIALQSILTQDVAKPFDLVQGPLWRVTLFHLDSEQYTLSLLIHHIIADGWSIGIFFQELTTLYTAFSTGQSATLPELPIQYADFAAWQRINLQEERLAEHLHYWQQQLAGAPEVLELPTDFPRTLVPTHQFQYPQAGREKMATPSASNKERIPSQTRRGQVEMHQGATYTFALSSKLTESLRTLSRQQGVTLYITLVAAFQLLLHRYTGQDDLIIGTATADRAQPEVQGLLGIFLNTVVLRTSFAGNLTVQDLLTRVRDVVLDAYAHQELPFERLVQELHLRRSVGHSPLFQVSLQLDPPSPISSTPWTLTRMSTGITATKFDLSLELDDLPAGLIGHLEYSTDLFDASTIVRMAGHWETLLRAMVDDPTQHLSTLPLLTDAERQQLLSAWNNTQVIYPRSETLTHLFEAQVERTPTAIAITFNTISLSYQDLNAQVNQFAHYLQQHGIEPGARIALCYERSHELIVALLGILKAGGTYVPLDPAYPSERLAFMLNDSQAAALVTQQHLLEHLPRTVPINNVICLDLEWQAIKQESQENLLCLVSAEDPAYMLYTSGSTGTPKGVLGTHRAAINRFNWMWRTYPFAHDEVCCQKTTLSFVDSVWEIFGPLLQGIPTVIIPDVTVKDPQQFLQTLATHSVTRIVLVPSLLRVLLDSEALLNEYLPNLKYWICSGETLPLELVQRFQQQLPKRILLNLYGSSEVAADATYYEIKDITGLACIPIGRPIDNTQIYLLDQHMQLAPIGVPGELHIGGDGLALGYFNRPALTTTKFVAHPFSSQPQALLYKTGDWARYLPDGNIEYLGRLDHQVKLRGMRIELGEIESMLGHHPHIHTGVVMAREDVPGDQRLVAYVVFYNRKILAHSEIQQYLTARLPAYMVPSTYVDLDALPLMPNGKVDRYALPAPDTSRDIAVTYVAPQLTIHHQLVQIWEELLHVHPIGIRDNFFALGGHSFLATRLMARIEQVCGKKLPVSTLFKGATIEYLATTLLAETSTHSTTRTPVTIVQASGTRHPFFFLHGDWQGKALYCLKLAQALGEDQPFYILETYKYDKLEVLPTLEEAAAEHIAAMRAIQPEGPYMLGGWCNGALFAYEMAQQLQAAGQKVEMLVLMDPGSSTLPGRLFRNTVQRASRLLHLRQEQQLDSFLRLFHLYEYARLWNERRKQAAMISRIDNEKALTEIETAHPNFQWLLPSRTNLRQNYLSIFSWWASSYTIKPYIGKVAVFWAQEDNGKRRRYWESILAGKKDVDVYIVPGTHVTSRTKYAGALAEHLRECLRAR